MNLIYNYFDIHTEDNFQRIDDSTANDLNIDALFDAIDNTQTPIGQQYLYNLLRNIPHENKVKLHEGLIEKLKNDDSLVAKISKIFKRINRGDAYYVHSIIAKDYVPFSKWNMVGFRILQLLPTALIALLICTQIYSLILAIIGAFILNLLIHFKSKQNSFISGGSISQLYVLITVVEKLNKIDDLKSLNPNMSQTLQKLTRLKRKLSIFRFNVRLESDIAVIVFGITELFRIFFLIEPINLNTIFSVIKADRKLLEEIFNFVGFIDTMGSIVKLREEIPYYCVPQFTSENTLHAEDIYHPLIPNCVSNTFTLDGKSYLIMGSNMSGKTSFVRTVGLNVLLAQTLNTCFAHQMVLSKQKICTAIAINDSLTEGFSYYQSEVIHIKNIIEETAQGSNLILLDELFKGTNTIERIAAAKAVLEYLSKNPKNRILVATHDIELTKLLDKEFCPIYFTENIDDRKLSFEYKIKHESSKFKNAIRILEIYDFPSEIVKEALEVANKL